MGLLPREASYAEEVTDFFLAFRGAGVALSPLDAELVLDWQSRGVPYEIVCRGIRRAAEKRARDLRPGEPALRTLRSCARAVEEEFKRFQGIAAGRAHKVADAGSEAKPQDRLSKARAALNKAAREGTEPLRRAAERVKSLAQGKEPDPHLAAARVARVDEALALCFLRALPFSERLHLLRAARVSVGEALHHMSPRARKAALRAHRVLQARTLGELPNLR